MPDKKTPKDLDEMLQEAASQTEEQMEVRQPPLLFFEKLVEEQTNAWYQRLWFELACLWGIAFVFISFLVFSILYAPVVFILIQVISTVLLVLYFVKESKGMALMRQ